MKTKIISLDPQKRLEKKAQKTMKRFFLEVVDWFPEGIPLDIMMEVITSAWNVANIEMMGAIDGVEMLKKDMMANLDGPQLALLNKLLSFKNKDYSEHHFFIVDMECIHEAHDIQIMGDFRDQEGYLEFLTEEFEPEEDQEDMVGYIDRNVLIVTPKKPYLDWVKMVNIENLHSFGTEDTSISTFLIDDMFDTAEEWVNEYYDHIFEHKLSEVALDLDNWPKNRSLKVFKKWFNVQFSAYCFDLEREPIYKI